MGLKYLQRRLNKPIRTYPVNLDSKIMSRTLAFAHCTPPTRTCKKYTFQTITSNIKNRLRTMRISYTRVVNQDHKFFNLPSQWHLSQSNLLPSRIQLTIAPCCNTTEGILFLYLVQQQKHQPWYVDSSYIVFRIDGRVIF